MTINVTKPFLPPMDDYLERVRSIWDRAWLTNNGPFVHELELQLKSKLQLEHLLYTCNGTIALQIAIKALNLAGEIITTPFSYVATTSSIVWEGCEPVMVDIDPDGLVIDPGLIEQAITPKTSAILATHVFGNPCDVHAIAEIANKHRLPVIYDAAHAFGAKLDGRSLFAYGDISTASFHATKLFHTVEGGAVISNSAELIKRMDLLRNFGHASATEIAALGVNGKNSEFHAAMGLCNLPYVDEIIQARGRAVERYDANLRGLPLKRQKIAANCEPNHAYYPVIFESEDVLLRVVAELNRHNIMPRRYFYPSLETLPYVGREYKVPVSQSISRRVLCLPLWDSISNEEIDMISAVMRGVLSGG
jgi:dTDP-4-amino-4,6-dideoxygalactose transaminase